MSELNDYYVYVYIDPRNLEEFYFGQGRGPRKKAHLKDTSDTQKTKRIAAIHKAKEEPIIRVIARGLTKHDALLVEKTLLWKLGRRLTNVSSGHYAKNFRPQDSLHRELTGFDYTNGIYFYNIGEGEHRCWEDYREFEFISAGGHSRFRRAMQGFNEGDIVAAYLRGKGFVGIGRVISGAKPVREVMVGGKALLRHKLRCPGMSHYLDSNDLCEYVARVKWIRTVDSAEAKRKPKKEGIYTPQHVRASLDNQPETVAFLEEAFNVDMRKLCLEG